MLFPLIEPFRGGLPKRPPDPNDPRALELLAPWKGERPPKFGLLGVPFDGAVLGRKGASLGPGAIREALRFSSSYHWESDTELSGLSAGDLGDLKVARSDAAKTHQRLRETMAQLQTKGTHPIVLGGDNSITWATAAGILDARAGLLGIVDLDAHLDVRVADKGINSGTPYRRILEDFQDRVRPRNVAQIGHRQFANSRTYRRWAERRGIRLFPMTDVRSRGFDAVLESALEAAGDGVEHLLLSVDMDALDQAHAPGVSAPTPGGLEPSHLFAAVRRAARDRRTRALEVVEVAPNLDPTGNTQRVAAVAVLEYLAVHAAGGKSS